MITSCVPLQACLDFLKGIHEAADTYKIALYSSLASLDETATVYSSTNEVSGAGYTAGGATLSGYSASNDSGGAWIDFDDPSWTSSTITARGAVIYNTSKSNKIIAIIDFGAEYSSSAGTFTVIFPTPNSTTGLIRFV